jgi:hypothetical protein
LTAPRAEARTSADRTKAFSRLALIKLDNIARSPRRLTMLLSVSVSARNDHS